MVNYLQKQITRWLDTRPDRQAHYSAQEIADGIKIPVRKVKKALSTPYVRTYIASQKREGAEWLYNRLIDEKVYASALSRGLQPVIEVSPVIPNLPVQVLWETLTPKRDNPGYVYVIKTSTGLYRLGRSKNPDARIDPFIRIAPNKVKCEAKIKTSDMRELEARYRCHYASCHVRGKWFALSDQDIADLQEVARMSEQKVR